ncbi:PIR Superfamily Protein [Plasmodium ovale wallikeri]|uniref:PIR Superfamily Protein n=1 Tax=Plasmodium ovale wallikeri TaxID=864142 RepID=A0A1A9AF18_PLAOA|nr:PIR Superfamily Protein [Plasmodium ovale wallikeri]SBT55961.1 PIR Superfamily Protein [Plasmodium ovale wallikeri]
MEYADDLLNESDEYKKYNEFNNVKIPNDYEISFNDALNIDPSNNIIKDICVKLAGNLKNISQSTKGSKNNEEKCGYLHFWLYDNISRNFENNDRIQDIIENIANGWIKYNRFISNENCSIRFSSDINLKKWIEGKFLHDYFKNFDYLKKTYGFNNYKCEEYSKYISHINMLYKNYKNIDYYSYSIHRHLLSYSSEKYDPTRLISELQCENKKTVMASHALQHASTMEVVQEDKSLSTLESEGAYIHSPSADLNSSSIFTPLGTRIKEKIKKRKQIRDNIDNVTKKLLNNQQEYTDINDDYSIFHVPYKLE